MKKFLLLSMLLSLVFAGTAYSATAGACTQTQETIRVAPNSALRIITFTCTANSGDGTFPAIAFDSTITTATIGWHLYKIITNPGSTAPTDNWDFTITDGDGFDVLGGTGANRDTANTEQNAPLLATGIYWAQPMIDPWTLNISGNSVNSATLVIKAIFTRNPIYLP